MKCQSEYLYPKLDSIVRNPQSARLIMHSYAGDVSEDTAIHQYLFQSVILKEKDEEVSDILEQIAEVEMHHFQYLAELIQQLGVYPVFVDPIVDKNEFWTSRYVCYDVEVEDILEMDMEAEKKAIMQYQSLIHVIEDQQVKEALRRIVVDEKIHLEIFEKLLSVR